MSMRGLCRQRFYIVDTTYDVKKKVICLFDRMFHDLKNDIVYVPVFPPNLAVSKLLKVEFSIVKSTFHSKSCIIGIKLSCEQFSTTLTYTLSPSNTEIVLAAPRPSPLCPR